MHGHFVFTHLHLDSRRLRDAPFEVISRIQKEQNKEGTIQCSP